MIRLIPKVLDANALDAVREALAGMNFVDGRASASAMLHDRKYNLQRERTSRQADDLDLLVVDALRHNEEFERATLPRRIIPPLFNRYEVGMHYGPHVDAALMGARETPLRADVSVTVFLTEPEDYEGGELIIQTDIVDEEIKLPAGSAVIYPSIFHHWVEPVTAGRRDAAVLWVQSFVRDPNDRAMLFELSQASGLLNAENAGGEAARLVNKTYTNLLRKLAEV
ncbi:MAG: Fe2+-dependent dioxygenase [Chromatiales bacterium]|nr:Fe2+-dependent dioxygenase [Chromatiales bacterium]